MSNLCLDKRDECASVLKAIPSRQIIEAALYEFLFCGGDRHAQNIYVDGSSNLYLIDNDQMLGAQASNLKGSKP